MTTFVLYDEENNGYVTELAKMITPNIQEARKYKILRAAKQRASRKNCGRNIPPGHSGPSKYFRNGKQVVIHELDANGKHVATHDAKPVYIDICTKTWTTTEKTLP